MLAGVVASAVLATSCPATPVQYGLQRDEPREKAPWIAAGPGQRRLVGHLYSYSGMLGDARVRTSPGIVLYAGQPAKIGWMPRSWLHDWGRHLTIEGRQLDGPGHFRQRFGRALRPQFYPTGVTVPSVGCWRLTLRSGRREVTIVVRAIEPPPVPRCDLSEGGPDGVRATPTSSGIVAVWGWRTAEGGPFIYTGGRTPEGGETKVLWRVERRAESSITLLFDGPETFQQTWPVAAGEPGAFPSILIVPRPGCWRVTVRSGHIGGVIVFRAVAP